MPRKAQYNVDAVLSQAIDVFLEHGYHGAIMDEIIARTDFNRRGFYIEFGSKQRFLYRVLKHYQTVHLDKIMEHLESNQGLNSISKFCRAFSSYATWKTRVLNIFSLLKIDSINFFLPFL